MQHQNSGRQGMAVNLLPLGSGIRRRSCVEAGLQLSVAGRPDARQVAGPNDGRTLKMLVECT